MLALLRRIVPLEYKQRIRDFLRARRKPGQAVSITNSSEDEARIAVQADLVAAADWAHEHLIQQEAEIRALRDDLDEAVAKLKELEGVPIAMANLQNWIDVLRDGNAALVDLVYQLKGPEISSLQERIQQIDEKLEARTTPGIRAG